MIVKEVSQAYETYSFFAKGERPVAKEEREGMVSLLPHVKSFGGEG